MARSKIRGFRVYSDTNPETGIVNLDLSNDCYCWECSGAYQTQWGEWVDEYANDLAPVYHAFECAECSDDC